MKFSRPKACISLAFGVCLIMVGLTFSMLQSSLISGHSRAIKSDKFDYGDNGIENNVFGRLGLLAENKGPLRQKSKSEPSSVMQKVVYNRVGKCGSRSMLSLITKLSIANNFTFHGSPISNRSRVSILDMIDVVKIIDDLPTPSLYSRHIHYLDFAKFGMNPPVYINMIRDPVERFSSQYHFLRYGDNNKAGDRAAVPWKNEEKNMNINDCILNGHISCSADKLFYVVPYFCGQDIMCQRPSNEVLNRAKHHVLEHYLIVGYLEDFNGMLQVLEKILPRYFNGALEVWKALAESSISHTTTLRKHAVNETARTMLRERMKEEYDFYNFVKLRFRILKKQLGIHDV